MRDPEGKPDDRLALQIWQSVDTWADHIAVWEKKREPYYNRWEIHSRAESEVEITGLPPMSKRKFLKRTPLRWFQRISFFLLFYSVLFAFGCALFNFYDYFIRYPQDSPSYVDIISPSRGISVLPKLHVGNKEIYGNTIQYMKDHLSGNPDVTAFLAKYKGGGVTCTFSTPPGHGPCNFDVSSLGPCATAGTPCFIVKPNRIINWTPEPYTSEKDLPKNSPKELKDAFARTPANERSVLWLTCVGARDEDKRKILSINYFPSTQSYPSYYFPYNQQKGYQDPLVGVQMTVANNEKVEVYCKVWAKNVDAENVDVASITFLYIIE